jgi:1,4-alpha-glucan branching enzyme
MTGCFALLLHAHLPFVRHMEEEQVFEEHWLFEAITDCYLPLIQVLEGWQRDGLAPRVTLSVSPTLAAMLQDSLLQLRYRRRLAQLRDLSCREQHRTLLDPALHRLAQFYANRYQDLEMVYQRWGGNLIAAWKHFQEQGLLELATCSATHAVLPLLAQDPASIRAQVSLAVRAHESCFGAPPKGFWLPECAYSSAVDKPLTDARIEWFVVENRGLLSARPRPRRGTFAPVRTPSGLAVFGRDYATAQQVWSRQGGYPGDPRYRDYYRDIAFDLDLDYLAPFMPVPGQRISTGVKYHRIQDYGAGKEIYHMDDALSAVRDQARHFCQMVRTRLASAHAPTHAPPLIMAPFDAELFGHWWFEGPQFLDMVVRELALQPETALVTPSDYLRLHPPATRAIPADSSWGEGGYWRLWLNEKNGWIHAQLQVAQRLMHQLVRQHGSSNGLMDRALKQAGRELLLAQASDWPFMIKTNSCPDYAQRRISQHLRQFHHLRKGLENGLIPEHELAALESIDNLFPDFTLDPWSSGQTNPRD